MIQINKVLTAGAISASLVFGLTGCGKEPIPPKQISIQKMDTINMKYKFQDEFNDKPISKKSIKQKILSNVISASRYKNNKIYYNGNVNPTLGKIVNYQNNLLQIEYVNGDQNCNRDCKAQGGELTRVIFVIESQLKEISKNSFSLTANFPINYNFKPDSDVFGIVFDPLDKLNKLETDAKRMFQSLSKPLIINRSIEFKGEVNTNYPDKAIYANFKRILGGYDWKGNEKISDVKKQNSFNLIMNKKSFPLLVSVYPYRDGSKVTYSTNLAYTVNSNGNSTLSKEDVKKLHEKINDIINN